MTLTDKTVKWRIVLLTAAFALIGFVLEIGPVAGIFSLVNNGPAISAALTMELTALGFLAYLALAASAIIGLHISENEPLQQEQHEAAHGERPPSPMAGKGVPAREQTQVRARPELHQLRMLFTALGGYAVLKWISLLLMGPAAQRNGLSQGALLHLFQFGFMFVALGWFVLWQFLRWYAQQRKWIRLQNELLGVDVTRILAIIILFQPVMFLITSATRGTLLVGALGVVTLLLEATVVALAVILFLARPSRLRRTLIGIGVTGGIIVVLTVIMAFAERTITG